MKSLHRLLGPVLLATALAGPGVRVAAVELPAADPAALAAMLGRAQPGDTILLDPGDWRDARIELSVAGRAGAPLTVRAREPGRTVLTDGSSLTFAAPHVVVDSLVFTRGALTGGSVVTFKSDHCRLTNTAIVDYNPPDVATGYYWVYFDGSHNRMDRCFFSGKSHQQPLVGNAIKASRHNTAERCHFADIPYVPGRNGREIFRIWGYGGNEELGDDGAFFTIEANLFERAHGEGMEIISLKSNRNVVRGNTVVRTRGGLTNRSGNYNTIAGNLLLCDGEPGAYGMRLTGRHHVVADNVVRGGEYGIHLLAGEFIERDLTGDYRPILREGTPLGRVPAYNQPVQTLVARNVLLDNSGIDLLIGSSYKSGWPRAQRMLLPERCRFLDNLIIKSGGGPAVDAAVPDRTPPLDAFTFAPNEFAGNIVHGGLVRIAPPPAGIVVRPASVAPSQLPEIQPLTADDVGPEWVRARRRSGQPPIP